MKSFIFLLALFFLFGCINQHDIRGVAEVDGILVVEGHITDYESVITLSRSRRLSNDDWTMDYIFYANVFVEREDGTLFPAERPITVWPPLPRFVVNNGKLDANSRYRLRIEMGNVQYFSEFSYPIITPEIDSVFWRQGRDSSVSIHVATHSPDRQVMFYRWSFREDWEINSAVYHPDFPFRCWTFAYSREAVFGSAERTIFGRVIEVIHEIPMWDRRLSVLYRIEVTQNAISKQAHYYFENLQRNTEITGSIFSPTPSTLRGNIYNATDPSRHVIGFIDVSTTTRKRLYIPSVFPNPSCIKRTREEIMERHPHVYLCPYCPLRCGYIEFDRIPGNDSCDLCGPCIKCECGECVVHRACLDDRCDHRCDLVIYIQQNCVDCTFFGTTEKPYDWPI